MKLRFNEKRLFHDACNVKLETEKKCMANTMNDPTLRKKIWPAWTGFSGRKLWDWLKLLASLAVPIIVLIASLLFTNHQDKLNQAQHDFDRKSAQAQQEEDALKTYLDDMTTLLLDKKLGSQAPGDTASSATSAIIARAKTLIVLSRLENPQRKAIIVQFLYEVKLINDVPPIVSLSGADLHGADLHGTNLDNVNLNSSGLSGANLSGASLNGANLGEANLSSTDLSGADLSRADLGGANIHMANLSRADLTGALVTTEQLAQAKSLQGAILPDGSKHP
jgi:hypothetical protein